MSVSPMPDTIPQEVSTNSIVGKNSSVGFHYVEAEGYTIERNVPLDYPGKDCNDMNTCKLI